MEKAIMKNPFFLSQVSEEATKEDLYLAQDLQDTLRAHQDSCVGMAANMIGVRKRVIIIQFGLMPLVLFNPVLVKKEGAYETEEGCLSLAGSRKTSRFEKDSSLLLRHQLEASAHKLRRFCGPDLPA